eukprot:TRINITY_DN2208_c1_g1_i4.p1 TRINITY_DN2208_c1_g1~~TRINITY_DN2208_c1_g1_i4.p1  ORF type:complete len:424 (-),score=13.10 TRINITY_DN2208_c1_g1_i4:77-1189(-)
MALLEYRACGENVFGCGQNQYGNLGLGTTEPCRELARVMALARGSVLISMSCGSYHTAAVIASSLDSIGGQVFCWGVNSSGQLGVPEMLVFTPTPVALLSGKLVVMVACGSAHTCAVLENGHVYTWGRNRAGQLGVGGFESRKNPCRVRFPKAVHVDLIACGQSHTVATSHSGDVFSWGSQREHQLGVAVVSNSTDDAVSTPNCVSYFKQGGNISCLVCGFFHTVLIDNGEIYVWGGNSEGQLGVGDTETRREPCLVTALHRLPKVAVYAGFYQTAAVLESGQTYIWGYTQLGLGHKSSQCTPQLLERLPTHSKVIAMGLGFEHSFCLLDNGEAWSWGESATPLCVHKFPPPTATPIVACGRNFTMVATS